VLSGPAGSGKSHLARIWAARARAAFLPGQEVWEPAGPLRRVAGVPAVVVDDADAAGDEATSLPPAQRGARPRRQPPPDRDGPGRALADGAARPAFAAARGRRDPHRRPRRDAPGGAAGQAVRGPPAPVEPAVVGYLVPRLERSFAAVRGVVEALDLASLRARRAVTMPLARAVLAEHEARAAVAAPDGEGGT
jgi:hypothetical protein